MMYSGMFPFFFFLKGLSHHIFEVFLWYTILNQYFLRRRWLFLHFFIEGVPYFF
jgi:hypothetical protein